MKSKLLKLSFPIPFAKLSKCLTSSASLEQHKQFNYFVFFFQPVVFCVRNGLISHSPYLENPSLAFINYLNWFLLPFFFEGFPGSSWFWCFYNTLEVSLQKYLWKFTLAVCFHGYLTLSTEEPIFHPFLNSKHLAQ